MFDFGCVGLRLLQQCLRLWDELRLLVSLSKGKRVGCQDHGFVVPAMLTPDPSKGQSRIDRLRSLFNDLL